MQVARVGSHASEVSVAEAQRPQGMVMKVLDWDWRKGWLMVPQL